MNRDLGTYHVRVELEDGRGWIHLWNAGPHFGGGSNYISPLGTKPARPVWESEDHLIGTIIFQFTEGNYSCDCNKLQFLADAAQEDYPDDDFPCGETLPVKRLTLIRPDLTELIIYGA